MNTNNIIAAKWLMTLPFSLLMQCLSIAQVTTSSFQKTDEFVQSIGSLDSLNMGTIARIITQHFSEKEDKARAVFSWIATHIAYETNTGRANNPKYNTTDVVLKNRKATSGGYAALFQDMCSIADIRCLTVDGYLRKTTDDILEPNIEINHTWNVVQLGQSPDTWYYVDVTLASGWIDKKTKTFIPHFSDAYFFANKNVFNLQHYPDNIHWQLGKGPKSLKDFYQLPVIKDGAYLFTLEKMFPSQGLIKAKTSQPINFNFSFIPSKNLINKVSLLIDANKKSQIIPINLFNTNNTSLQFNYSFDTEGEFSVTVLINDKACLQYFVTVE